jgi:hypothetical protein
LRKWEACGVDRVNFLLNAAENIPQEQVLNSLRLFAKEVMPAFAIHVLAPQQEEAANAIFGKQDVQTCWRLVPHS